MRREVWGSEQTNKLKIRWHQRFWCGVSNQSWKKYLSSSTYEEDKFDGLFNNYPEDLTTEEDSEVDTIKEATTAVKNIIESITEEADSKEHWSSGLLEDVNSESLPLVMKFLALVDLP